jgi:hypothetical protein
MIPSAALLTRAFEPSPARGRAGGSPHFRDPIPLRKSSGGATLMAIHSKHLETLEAVIATALNIVKNRPLVDRDYTGEFRIRVQPESGQRYVITIKEE